MKQLLALALLGCHPRPVDRPPSEIVASLERGACNGSCAEYSVVIYNDGLVEYIGMQHVATRGVAHVHLSARELGELHQLFASANYFALGGSYERDHCNDAPLVRTSYQYGGKQKDIGHCSGPDVPRALTELEAALARLVRIERWTGGAKDHRD